MPFGSVLNNFYNNVYEGLTTADDLKDYRHASKLFLSDGYALAPQTKFLFHVYFTLNTEEIPGLQQLFPSIKDMGTIGMMVKAADLPKFDVDVQEMNQYNRKRYIQTKINYQPVNISFIDDSSDMVRSMWNAYYTYYYQDSTHMYDVTANADLSGWGTQKGGYSKRDIYDNLRNVNDWGFTGASQTGNYKPNFFKDIKIYGMNRGNFLQYTLINPIITSWAHDQFNYYDTSGTMQNTMTVRYETVKYARGRTGTAGNSNVQGFGDRASYDDSPSMFGKPGSVESVLGAGGLFDSAADVYHDLAEGNILGALTTTLTTYETFKDFDFSEGLSSASDDLLNAAVLGAVNSPTVTNAISNFQFPTFDGLFGNSGGSAQSSNGNLTSSWTNPDTGFVFNTANARGQQLTYAAPTVDHGVHQIPTNNPTDVNSNGVPVNSQWVNPDAQE
jgi:hypothetical protein